MFNGFMRNSKLYLLFPIITTVIDDLELHVSYQGQTVFLDRKIVKDEDGPVLVFIYSFSYPHQDVDNILIELKYKSSEQTTISIERCSEIPLQVDQKKELCLTTLFKNDYHIFPIFYDYYCRQGVQEFFMYYNGVADETIKPFFDKPNVTLVDWDFDYWNSNEPRKYMHNAQMGQIHHSFHRYGKDKYDFVIFCDMDEYMSVENTTLVNYVKKDSNSKYDVFGFLNRWSRTLNNNIPKVFENTFYSSSKCFRYRDRSKNIVRTSSVNELVCIHYTHTPG
jgi:hypothetical protein